MLLYKLEKKFGRYAIKNLSLYLIIGYVIGFVVQLINPQMYAFLTFNPYAILHGQIWRIFTWVLTLPSDDNIIFMVIMLFFYYSIGRELEYAWGTFRYNVYLFSGMLFTVLGGIILYIVLLASYRVTGSTELINQFGFSFADMFAAQTTEDMVPAAIGYGIGSCVSTYYINMSIFLAFAVTYPDMQVLLYFIIPLKVKWLGILYAVFIVFEAISTGWGGRVMIIASLLNFLIFFFTTRNYNRVSPKEIKRKRTFRKKTREAEQARYYSNGARHKCAVCGRTELDDPNLTFRYCSKCTGGKEYCQDHLFTHEHK